MRTATFGRYDATSAGFAENLFVQPVVYGSGAYEKQPAGHEQIADEKYPRDQNDAGLEQPEAQPIQARSPSLSPCSRAAITSAFVLPND